MSSLALPVAVIWQLSAPPMPPEGSEQLSSVMPPLVHDHRHTPSTPSQFHFLVPSIPRHFHLAWVEESSTSMKSPPSH